MLNQKNNQKIFFVLLSILFGLSSVYLSAQDKPSVMDKLDKIKGEAKSIIIETKDAKVVFKGDEAKELLEKLKSKTTFEFDDNFSFKSDSTDEDIFIINKRRFPFNKSFMWNNKIDSLNRNVEVEMKDGKTTVTIKTNKDGNENVEVLTGEDAEKFLEHEKQGQKSRIKIFKKSNMNIGCGNCCCENRFNQEPAIELFDDDDSMMSQVDKRENTKKIIVKDENGEKVVTVETVDDGNKKVETYKGKEADEYLKKIETEKKIKMDEEMKDGKVIKKIIVK